MVQDPGTRGSHAAAAYTMSREKLRSARATRKNSIEAEAEAVDGLRKMAADQQCLDLSRAELERCAGLGDGKPHLSMPVQHALRCLLSSCSSDRAHALQLMRSVLCCDDLHDLIEQLRRNHASQLRILHRARCTLNLNMTICNLEGYARDRGYGAREYCLDVEDSWVRWNVKQERLDMPILKEVGINNLTVELIQILHLHKLEPSLASLSLKMHRLQLSLASAILAEDDTVHLILQLQAVHPYVVREIACNSMSAQPLSLLHHNWTCNIDASSRSPPSLLCYLGVKVAPSQADMDRGCVQIKLCVQ